MNAIDKIKHLLTLPIVSFEDHRCGTDEAFDPWEAFPCLYGSYSAEFDDMAILVLENIQHERWGPNHGETLAHEMFREMLCTADLCDYGSSPRGCFPNWSNDFSDILPDLIAKWKAYRAAHWAE